MTRRTAAAVVRAAVPDIVQKEEEELEENSTKAHSRRAGEMSAESLAKKTAAEVVVKQVWGIKNAMMAFPKEIRPEHMGCTGYEYLKNIAGRIDNLKEARPYFLKYAAKHKKNQITWMGLRKIMDELKASDPEKEMGKKTSKKVAPTQPIQPTPSRQSRRGLKLETATYTVSFNKNGKPCGILKIKTPKGFKLLEVNIDPKATVKAAKAIVEEATIAVEEIIVAEDTVITETGNIEENIIDVEQHAANALMELAKAAVEVVPKSTSHDAPIIVQSSPPSKIYATVYPPGMKRAPTGTTVPNMCIEKRSPPLVNEFDTRPIKRIRIDADDNSLEIIGQASNSSSTPTPKKTVKIVEPNPKNDSSIGLGASTHGLPTPNTTPTKPVTKSKWQKGSWGAKIEAAKEKSRKMKEAQALLPKYGPMESYIRNLPENVSDMFPSKKWLKEDLAEQNPEMAEELYGMFDDIYKYMQDETTRICDTYRKA